MNQIDLAGRTAIITGGARGMGYAIAERLLASGASVVLWDIDADRVRMAGEALGCGERVLAAGVDVTDYDAVSAGVAEAKARFGRIDILVNAAGIAGQNATVADYPLNVWRQVQRVNLDGCFHTCRAVVPHMLEGDYGRIVNIASVAGKEGNPNASAYSVSKAGVIALTKSLGKELARTNICVNVVTPAVIKTEMLDDVKPEHIEYMLSKIPMGRMGSVEEISSMVAWLSSPECSYSTGAVFDMTGGRATY